ncbi:MAG: NAD+ synthase [Kiritimatiellae bacterium]|nr:NAD+ synthase [Kiritimatiellia bacterium]
MTVLKTALAQVNVTMGALRPNADKIAQHAHDAASRGADIIVFPELALCGYPPEDLALRKQFIEDIARELKRLTVELPPDTTVIVGAPLAEAGRLYNAALIFQGGALRASYRKIALPNYGVFDEKRIFTEGREPLIIGLGKHRIGIHICEDSWDATATPCAVLAGRVDCVINLSASPYERGKLAHREQMLRDTARAIGAPLLYCNLVGGQDELVFDGASMAVDANGVFARARQFEDDLLHVAIPKTSKGWKSDANGLPRVGTFVELVPRATTNDDETSFQPRIEAARDEMAEVYTALATGLRDYTNKNGFNGVLLGLSGGLDSALVAALAVDALGAERVHGVTMPSRFSSDGTRGDAFAVAENLGIEMVEAPIQKMYETVLNELAPLWPGRKPDATEENIQARIRGLVLMALSNKFGWLVLTTGNKSEVATGYCTLYGDMVGGFAALKDVTKTLAYKLARWRNSVGPREVIPETTITRAPSAELRENQTDQDTLPPYEVLDEIIERYVERDLSRAHIVAEGFDEATVARVIRMIDASEYKRQQAAPGVKITTKAFGPDRRLPITNWYRG